LLKTVDQVDGSNSISVFRFSARGIYQDLPIASGSDRSLLPETSSFWSCESWPIASGSVLNLRSDKFSVLAPLFRAFSMPAGLLSCHPN
jgi:hypothetical protein